MFFKKQKHKNMQINRKETKSESNGLIIQFTPIAVYLYITKDYIESYLSNLSFQDKDDRNIEIGGSFISIEINNRSEIEDIIKQYSLDKTNLPLITIECKNKR